MKIKNIKLILPKLKTKLPEYLKETKLLLENNKIRCPNYAAHKNNDEHPSASFVPNSNRTLIYCFVEKRPFDILDVYALVHKKAINGEFFYLAIEDLCKKYNIYYETESGNSPKEIEIRKKREILTKLHILSFNNVKAGNGLKYYKLRNLSKAKIQHFKIGYLEPKNIPESLYTEFNKYFDYQLNRVFNHPALVIPIYTQYNQYWGLSLRQFDCPKEDKYLHLFLSSGGKGNIFNTNNVKSSEEVYITEGCFDTIAMFPETNVIACLTNIITEKGIEYLADMEFKKVNLVLDPDNFTKGEATDGILKTILRLKNLDTVINVIKIPENLDPDDYLKKHTLEEFKNLPNMEGIDYLLSKVKTKIIGNDKIYDFIATCPNLVLKERYITKVAESLKIGKRNLTKKLEELNENSSLNLVQYVKEKDFLSELIEDFAKAAWNKKYVSLSSGFELFDKNLGGFEDTLYLLIGHPEMAKTSWLLNLTYNLLKDKNNFVALYSLDDGLKRAIIPRFVSLLTGLTSNQIKNPTEATKDRWMKGLKQLSSLKDRLTMKDGGDIRTVWDLGNFVNIHMNIANENNKKFIILIDNLHTLTASAKLGTTEDSKKVINFLKRLPQKYFCPIIATAEVPKGTRGRPSGEDIKDSIEFWYAARFVGGLYNDINQRKQTHLIWENNGEFNPIFELYISKNQTGHGWHGSLFYKLDRQNNKLIECSADEMQLLKNGQSLF